jgi:hypothetical protein
MQHLILIDLFILVIFICGEQYKFYAVQFFPTSYYFIPLGPNILLSTLFSDTLSLCSPLTGCSIAQAVSHWLPTAVAQVQAQVWSCGICGGQNGARAGFLRVLQFPLPIFHQLLHNHQHLSSGAGTISLPSELSLTQLGKEE